MKPRAATKALRHVGEVQMKQTAPAQPDVHQIPAHATST